MTTGQVKGDFSMTYFVTIVCLPDPDDTRLGPYLAIVSAMYQYCYSVLLKWKKCGQYFLKDW